MECIESATEPLHVERGQWKYFHSSKNLCLEVACVEFSEKCAITRAAGHQQSFKCHCYTEAICTLYTNEHMESVRAGKCSLFIKG